MYIVYHCQDSCPEIYSRITAEDGTVTQSDSFCKKETIVIPGMHTITSTAASYSVYLITSCCNIRMQGRT